MPAIELTVNIFVLPFLVILSFAAGFLLRRIRQRSLQKRIIELENEMLLNHAEILGLQKNKAQYEQSPQDSKIRVIPLNSAKEDMPQKKVKKQ
jgi:hypothetical protein